ncbi:MAG TPA: GNAT family N-acetyltransferase [Polaromonas sp.]|uniref:GNAT family N-acetyltransferase n=1 Tax=Polaromonas sp. TaxID=1869339 RepID=UPI002D5389BF|nr:GNAT family N-acetyltransferase [Polaromonas sp.]HYW56270.1 GNAT family N-acetyltransferase [Polaromonas sp.]
MVNPATFIKASLDAGKELFRQSPADGERTPAKRPVMVPIRSLGPTHGNRIEKHLLALDERDRYLRFGYVASDEQIGRYVAGLNFERDEIFGIYNRKLELIAMAHMALSIDPYLASRAEFGVSVLTHARGRGYGARLFDRAVMHARNDGVTTMFIHALSENTAMLNIARKAGAVIERDGSESEGHLTLPPADLDSRVTEMLEEQIAQTDYRLKVQAKQFRDILAAVQDVRNGVRDSRDRMPM